MTGYFLKWKLRVYFLCKWSKSSSLTVHTDHKSPDQNHLHTFQRVNHWSTSEITKELTHQHSLNNTEATVLSKTPTYATGTRVLLLWCAAVTLLTEHYCIAILSWLFEFVFEVNLKFFFSPLKCYTGNGPAVNMISERWAKSKMQLPNWQSLL